MNIRALTLTFTTVMLVAPTIATATPVTYNFTGYVNSGSGLYNSIASGETVTGTYTIDLANANDSLSDSVSSTTVWNLVQQKSSSLFSMTAEVAGFSYTSQSYVSGSYGQGSNIKGYPGRNQYNLSEGQQAVQYGDFYQSLVTLVDPNNQPWTSTGLPVFSSTTVGTGNFEFAKGDGGGGYIYNQLNYTITSITPVPIPTAALLMFSGIGSLVGVSLRKKP